MRSGSNSSNPSDPERHRHGFNVSIGSLEGIMQSSKPNIKHAVKGSAYLKEPVRTRKHLNSR